MSSLVVFLAIALPWLNPFAPAPSPAVRLWLVTLACFAVVLLLAARVRLGKVAAAAWLAAALLSAVMGLLQYFGATAALGPWVIPTGVGEAFANLRQRNHFATLTNIGLAALLWWVVQGAAAPVSVPGTARRTRLGWHMAAVAAAVLLAVGNVASSSRTGLVQLVLLMVLAGVWGGARRAAVWRVLLAAALAYGLAMVLLPMLSALDSGMVRRLQEGDLLPCASRLTLWGNVLHLIAQKPWLGWGWGELDYAHFITLYPGDRYCEIMTNAHNLPLHLAAELGVPLALLLCSGGLWLVWRAKPWRESDATRQLAWSVLALILLHSLLEYPLWYGPFQVAFGLSVWLLGRRSAHVPAGSLPFWTRSRALPMLAAIVLAASAGYAAWDYQRIRQLYLPPLLRAEAYRHNTLEKVGNSWLFHDFVEFAEVTMTPLRIDNAAHIHDLALEMLHFSPEPHVVEALIESATLLGRQDEALFYLARYRAAFPLQHAQWAQGPAR